MAAVMKEVSAPRAAARKTAGVPTDVDSAPFARFLDQIPACTAERVRNDQPIRMPETDPVARAIRQMGGISKASSRTTIDHPQLLQIIFGGDAVDPRDCVLIERGCMQKVTCEEMRDDLLWFRDAGNEVVGFAERIDSQAADLDAAIKARFAETTVAAKDDRTTKPESFLADLDLEALTSAAQEVMRVIRQTKDQFVRGMFVVGPSAHEGYNPWSEHGCISMLSKAAKALDQANGDVLVAAKRAEKVKAERASMGGFASTEGPDVSRVGHAVGQVFTSEHAFNEIPTAGMTMFSVNPDMPIYWKVSELSCMLDACVEVAFNGCETPITSAQAWMLERNLSCAKALAESVFSNLEAGA